MIEYSKDIQYIKGVGPNRVKLLNKLGFLKEEENDEKKYKKTSKKSNKH